MGLLKYVETQINKLDDSSTSLFRSFLTDVECLRKKGKTINNNIGTYMHDVKDIFNVVIRSCSDNTTTRESIDKNSSFNDTYVSGISYWLNKVYDLNTFTDQYYKIYQLADSIRKTLFIFKNNPLRRIYNMYNVLVGDGTVCKCSFRNDHGKNIASYTVSIILNMATNLVYDHTILFNNNELTGILNANLTKSDIIVLDRGYSKLSFMDKLAKRTYFVIRLTRNLMIYKRFMKMNEQSMIIKRNGYKIKLIKYSVDKETREIIKSRYNGCDNNDEDDDSIFVIATNLTDLSSKEMSELYKNRWSVEVCNKNIKSNFNIRHIVKQYNSLEPIKKISFYTSLSILIYNITTLEKRLLEMKYYYQHQKRIEYNYSQHVNLYKEYLIDTINPVNKTVVLTAERKMHRLIVNKRSTKKKKNYSRNNKIRGKYKSLEYMAKLNNRDDIISQIKKYYKKEKDIMKLSKFAQFGD